MFWFSFYSLFGIWKIQFLLLFTLDKFGKIGLCDTTSNSFVLNRTYLFTAYVIKKVG